MTILLREAIAERDLAAEASEQLSLSVIVPIYNEEESIPPLVERLNRVLTAIPGGSEIIAVDDGSRDRSFAILRELAAHHPHLRVIRFRRNFGQTAAFAAGFAAARGAVVVTIDADLQNDPNDIPALLTKVNEGFDVVSGWRERRQDNFFSRTLPSRLANALISYVTGVHLHDYGCSLKAYRAEVVKNIQLYGELHRFIPAIASWQGVAVTEIPVHHEPRRYGASKYGISRTFRVLLDLVTVRFLLSYGTRPMQIFGSIGLLAVLGGIAINIYLVLLKLFTNADIGSRPLLLLGILLVILGIQFISLGLIGELVVRVYYEAQNKPIYVVREELNNDREAVAERLGSTPGS